MDNYLPIFMLHMQCWGDHTSVTHESSVSRFASAAPIHRTAGLRMYTAACLYTAHAIGARNTAVVTVSALPTRATLTAPCNTQTHHRCPPHRGGYRARVTRVTLKKTPVTHRHTCHRSKVGTVSVFWRSGLMWKAWVELWLRSNYQGQVCRVLSIFFPLRFIVLMYEVLIWKKFYTTQTNICTQSFILYKQVFMASTIRDLYQFVHSSTLIQDILFWWKLSYDPSN